jgi:hypothetical protein
MRPPTQYLGSKGRLGPWIASLLPPHRTYVEPFAEHCTMCGGPYHPAPSARSFLR